MEVYKLTPCAKWTDDCQGKKDYDGRLLSISTRYWPSSEEQQRGSHWNMLDDSTGELTTHPYDGKGRASAHTSIVLNYGQPDEYGYGDAVLWRDQDFVADSREAVQRLVEQWVQERLYEVCQLLGIRLT